LTKPPWAPHIQQSVDDIGAFGGKLGAFDKAGDGYMPTVMPTPAAGLYNPFFTSFSFGFCLF